MDQPYYPLEECQQGGLYYLRANNLSFGIYIAEIEGFVGIRRKLGTAYLFVEYHFDYSSVIGTAQPITLLSNCPESLLSHYLRSRDDQDRDLMLFLTEAEAQYGKGI